MSLGFKRLKPEYYRCVQLHCVCAARHSCLTIANYALYLLCSNWTQSMSKCHDTSIVMSRECAENLQVAMV